MRFRQMPGRLGQNRKKLFGGTFAVRFGHTSIILLQIFRGFGKILIENARRNIHTRVLVEQVCLFRGSLSRLGLISHPQRCSERIFILHEFLLKSLSHVLLLLRFSLDANRSRFSTRRRRFLSINFCVKRDKSLRRKLPGLPVQRRSKNCPQCIVIGLRNRVVSMIMTLRTANAESQQRRTHNLDRVANHLIPRGRIIFTTSCSICSHPQVASCSQQLNLFSGQITLFWPGEFITRNLFGDESIKRLVGVE